MGSMIEEETSYGRALMTDEESRELYNAGAPVNPNPEYLEQSQSQYLKLMPTTWGLTRDLKTEVKRVRGEIIKAETLEELSIATSMMSGLWDMVNSCRARGEGRYRVTEWGPFLRKLIKYVIIPMGIGAVVAQTIIRSLTPEL